MKDVLKNIHFQPAQILALGFFGLIIVGTILLNLPIASNDGQSIGFINALFTSTSAVCVTGLVIANSMEQWTLFGKVVIIILIQIGGLGIMTLATTFFLLMGRKIGLKERLVIQEALNQNKISGVVRLTRNIIFGTLFMEGIGALILMFNFFPDYTFIEALGLGIFHSISAFCNAGFDVLSYSSLSPYVHNWSVNLTVSGLIILGGLGFTVWHDVIDTTRETFRKKRHHGFWFHRLGLHTKIVLVLTATLLFVGFVLFFLLEMNNPGTMQDYTWSQKILASIFQSVTTRTAGFNTIALDQMTDGSKFITIILMFIGGSPAGTAGGIKTVTLGVLFFSVISTIRSREETEAFNRRIPEDIIKRSLAIIMISLGVVISVTIILTITESQTFLDAAFEAVSAFATVGLSLGITGELSTIGKIVIAMTMFIGRLGPMTLAVAMAIRYDHKKISVRKPSERVMVG
jgi:trk system potassium uptake protein TrkH